MSEHGTISGATAHRRDRTTPCADCRAAWAAYMAERRRTPKGRAEARFYSLANARAKQRLVEMHRDQFRALVKEERTKLREEGQP